MTEPAMFDVAAEAEDRRAAFADLLALALFPRRTNKGERRAAKRVLAMRRRAGVATVGVAAQVRQTRRRLFDMRSAFRDDRVDVGMLDRDCIEAAADAVTERYLHPQLAEIGVDQYERYRVMFETTHWCVLDRP